MQRVDGIGGVFLYANDAAALAKWYGDVLGIELVGNEKCDNYYMQFEQRDAADPSREIATVFAIFQADPPLGPTRRECRLNFRVLDLAAMIGQLAAKGLKVEKQEDYDYGRFAWIRDPEGNSLELYQPTG
jgi:predicted enzyme related to lactoylglutathione lyase